MDAHKNFAYSTVATAPSPATSGTSLVVAAGDGAKFPAVPFNATVWATGANALASNAEIVRVTAISTDTLTITRAQESTSARTVVVGDQIAATITERVLNEAEQGVELASRGTTSSLASTYDRAVNVETNQATLATGVIFVHRILLPRGLSVSNITFWSMTTAGGTLTNQWFALFDSSKNKLAITADDTSTAWAANSAKTLAVTGGPYVTTTAGWYYLGIMVKATTVPTFASASNAFGSANIRNAAPLPCFTADAGLTNPASCPTTLGAATVRNTLLYAEIS